MHKVLLLALDSDAAERISALPVWGVSSGFEITAFSKQLIMSYEGFDLIIAGAEAGLTLLRTVKSEHLPAMILYSREPSFEAARQGMILRSYDYITEKSEAETLAEALIRLQGEISGSSITPQNLASRITAFFDKRDEAIYDFISEYAHEFKTRSGRCSDKGREVFSIVREDVFSRYPWLDLYINDRIYRTAADTEDVPAMIMTLFSEFRELCPQHSSQLDELFDRILFYPDEDLRQKTLSAELHINSTYLSTVFLAQTGIRFVDYINSVKLKRAAFLLLDTSLGVTEIASRLDYKDNSYFSKLFRTKYGVTPSMFRLPNDYDFQI